MKHREAGRKNDRLSTAGAGWLRRLVRARRIPCRWSDRGRLYVAAGADPALRGVSDGFDSPGPPRRALDRDGIEAVTGSRCCRRGVRVGGSAPVQPAAPMRGLAAAHAALCEESPVPEIDARSGFRLACPGGAVEAPRVVLCPHVFAEEWGLLKHRTVLLARFAGLTGPLADSQAAMPGREGEFGLLPAHPNGSTVRLTQDRRIPMRNTLR